MRNRIGSSSRLAVLLATLSGLSFCAQDAAAPKPALHVIGPVLSVAGDTSTLIVKSDKDGQSYTFTLTATKTLLKVPPGAKDLKTAVRITPNDLQPGDRVDVRYADTDASVSPIPARSVLLMSAHELQQAHQQETAEWQSSLPGSVTAIDASTGTLTAQLRTPQGPHIATVQTAPDTVFTRYSPDHPSTPDKSSLAEIHSGDQIRIIGDLDGDSLKARKVYTASFRSVQATIVSVDAASNTLVAKDLHSKQNLTVAVSPEATLRKLPPAVAAGIAHRFNAAPGANKPTPGSGAPPAGAQPGAGSPPAGAPGAGGRAGGGDPSRMLEHMPPMSLSDLKPGDAVLLTVAQTKDPARVSASSVIAGVEPIFQSAAPSQGRGSGGGDNWSLDLGVPAQ